MALSEQCGDQAPNNRWGCSVAEAGQCGSLCIIRPEVDDDDQGLEPCPQRSGPAPPEAAAAPESEDTVLNETERNSRPEVSTGAEAEATAAIITPEAKCISQDWKPGQYFSREDDPDRIEHSSHQLPTPSCPNHRKAQLVTKRIVLPWVRQPYFAVGVHNLMNPDECRAVIDACNQKGFTPALLPNGEGGQYYAPDTRDGWRCLFDSPGFTEFLYTALRNLLPQE